MAGKKKGSGNVNDDDLDLKDLDDLDSDMDFGDLEDIGDDRSPSTAGVAKELGKEAAGGFLDGLIKQTAKKSLPDEYAYNYGEALDYAEFGKDVLNRNKSRLERTLFKLGTEVKKILPFQSKMLDNFLQKYTEENERAREQSEEAMREAGIQSNVAAIFDKQLEVQKALEARREAKEQVEAKERLATTKLSIDTLTSIDNNVAQQTAFTLQIGKEYYKKSLELQFKSYFIQADMLKTMRDYYKGFSIQFDSVVKNTGLPEYVKLTTAERAGELVRNKAMESVYKQVFSNSKYVESVKKRMGNLVNTKVDDALSGIDAFTDQLEMLNSATDSPSGVAKMMAGILASLGGSSMGEKVADKISPKIKDKIKDNKYINSGGKYLDMLASSPATFFATMREKAEKGRDRNSAESTPGEMLKSKFFGGLSELLSVTAPESMEFKVKSDSALSHKSPAIFDNKVHRSISEVIPMYLARILKQNTDLTKMYGTVNKRKIGPNYGEADELHYDYEGRKLVNATTLKDNVEKKVLASSMAKSRSKSLSGSLLRQGKGKFEKDKKANAKELKILNNKASTDLLENYFFKASKIEGVDKNFQTLISDAIDPAKAKPELAALLDRDPKLRELLAVLKKAQGTESTEYLDRSLGDLGTTYPTAALMKLLSDTSKLAGSKVLNVISNDNAQKLARGFLRYIMDSSKDVTPDTVLNGQALRGLTTDDFKALKPNLTIFTSEVKRVLENAGMVGESSLSLLFGLMNKSLRESVDIDPEVFQKLYDLNPILGNKGKLSTENLIERRLGDFNKQDYVDLSELKSVTKVVKENVNEARSDILDRFTNSDLFKGATEFKKDITSAGKDPRKIFSAVTKHAKRLGTGVSALSKTYYDKASKRFTDIETLMTHLTDRTARATIATLVVKVGELDNSIVSLIDAEKAALVEKERTLTEMRARLSEVGNDPAAERAIEREIKTAKAYHNDKVKILESVRTNIQAYHKQLKDLETNAEQKSVKDLISEVRTILSSNINKLKDLLEQAKAAEDQNNQPPATP